MSNKYRPTVRLPETTFKTFPITKETLEDKMFKDLIYADIMCNSYPDFNGRTFVHRDKYSNVTKLYERIKQERQDAEAEEPFMSIDTFRKYFKHIKDFFLEEGTAYNAATKTDVECYFVKTEFQRFQLINLRTLDYLKRSANMNSIKIYAILLNKYAYYLERLSKNEITENDYYWFSYDDLARTIGLAPRNRNTNNSLKAILNSLANNGLIVFKEAFRTLPSGQVVPTFNLVAVYDEPKAYEGFFRTSKKEDVKLKVSFLGKFTTWF